ncbi:MAG: ACP S-malonyltransferase, partial [Actinomycetota bacterium]
AGAVSLTDALRIISVRAEATDEAGRSTPGAMAAVMRVDREVVDRICAREGVALAAENGPGQFVVSGPVAGLKRAIEALAAAGAVSRHLDVSAAFHSPVMRPAAERLQAALDGVSFEPPRFEVWSPTTSAPVRTGDEIRAVLIDQLTSPVRWRETIEGVAARHGSVFCDLGPGRVVAGLTRRIVKGAEIRTLDDLLVTTSEGAE